MTVSRPPLYTNVYGLARSVLALGTLLTLAFNDVDVLFRPAGTTVAASGVTISTYRLGLFALLDQHLELARWIAIAGLALVVAGWRPRFTGVLHWWIAFSFSIACVPLDGGDQVAAVLSLLLVPVTLLDSRRTHWEAPNEQSGRFSELRAFVGITGMWLIRLQVAVIYFHAAVAKIPVTEWANGTVLYYWFLDPQVGLPSWAQPWVTSLLTNPLAVCLLTWSVMVLEVVLFLGLTSERRWRGPMLAFGIAFHAGIVVIFGLVSFFCSMTAALLLFLRPWDRPWNLQVLREAVSRRQTIFHRRRTEPNATLQGEAS